MSIGAAVFDVGTGIAPRTAQIRMNLECCDAQAMVTVGTAVASRPPYGSRRALLTHRALPSGSGVESVTWQWYEEALMYQPTKDAVALPTYSFNGPNHWTDVDPPLSAMPEF
jgi:hypothetical protein